MTPEQAQLVIAAIRKHQSELLDISDKARHTDNFALARERLQSWAARTEKMLAESLSGEEAGKFRKNYPRVIFSDHQRTWNMAVQGYLNPLSALAASLEEFPQAHQYAPGDRALPSSMRPTSKDPAAATTSGKVFIIHGHDEVNLLRLEKMLRTDHHVDVAVLCDAPEKGRTTIEEFEEAAADSGFAFAFYASDDVVDGANTTNQHIPPSVVFELGWFCGRLGRDKACLLYKKGTTIHPDLAGINRVEYGSDVRQAQAEITKALKAAGILS